jgi:chemotaxis protein MotB
MTENGNDPSVRIVVKKKKGHDGHHGGAWKVAYADFVTAMMALFIVLWIVGQNKQVKQAVAGYFNDPGAFSEKSPSGGGILPGSNQPEVIPQKVEKQPTAGESAKEIEKLRVEGRKIEGIISAAPVFEKFKDRIQVIVSDEGLRIELIENSIGLFFDVGSANLKSETVSLLKLVATELGKLPNLVIIEGYTDARAFGAEGYTNWELSTDRANKARKILEDSGLWKGQVVEVRGFADRKLNIPQDPLDASNRRVSIFLLPAPDSSSKGQVENRDLRDNRK